MRVSTAGELHRRGVAANNAGRYAEARRLLTRAHALAADTETSALVECSLAHLEAETGDWPAALARCDDLLARAGLSGRTQGMVHGQRAMLLMIAGRLPESLVEFSAAATGLAEDPEELGRVLLNRGNVHLQLLAVGDAEADFRAAVPALEHADLPLEAAMAGHNLGYCRFLAGDLVEALRLMDRAAVVLVPLGPVSEATGQQDRAEVLMAVGLVDDGRVALRAAARAYGSRRLRRRQAEAELALARAAVLADPAEAVVAARAAARHFRAADAPALATRADAVRLAAAVRRGDRGPALLDHAAGLEAALLSQQARWDAVTVALYRVRVLLARGDVDQAGGVLARVRVGRRAPLAVRLLDREVRAEHAAARGRRTTALAHLRSGLADLHAWQSSFGSLDLQTMVVGHGTVLGVRALDLAVEGSRPAELFEWSERARMLASRIQGVQAPQDEQTTADLTELRAGSTPDREAALRRRIREQAWDRPGSETVTDPVPLADLQAGLGADTALVAYVATARRVVALVVTDAGARRFDLGDRSALDGLVGGLLPDLDMAAGELPESFRAVVWRELDARLAGLASVLVRPVLEAVGDRRVVLTPSGVLAGVPWPLLEGYDAGRPVEVARSATSWLARRGGGVAAVSGAAASGAAVPGAARAGFVAGPRVQRAEAEVTAAAARWPGATVLTGPDATAGAVSDLAARVDVLHVSAHGRHAADNPLFSGVELVDGTWYGYDIDRLPAVPQVVLLSACELGRSTVRHGEELIGMTTAWLHAGARCVLAATAAVADEVAHDTLLAVHAGLRDGLDPAAALAGALGEPYGEASGRVSAPAPFVCFT